MIRRITILDGYTDEPAGLGVPPYLDVYPRLISGVAWLLDKSITISYWAVDVMRRDPDSFYRQAFSSDLVIIIAGAEVPGKYVGGTPLRPNELINIVARLEDKDKILVGPAARYGLSSGGGSVAFNRGILRRYFSEIVYGDVEVYIHDLLAHGWEKAEPWRRRENYELANKAFIRGAGIVRQHPNYGWNLIVEIETFRGCPRWISGGCSFCIEPRYGRPMMRKPEMIVREVEALYKRGVRHIRLGRQPDILAYMSKEIGEREYPEPNTEALEKLFHGIRNTAPGLRVLHIDNVNPGTITNNMEKAAEALKVIVKYHTPGDVAAFGIESFDEKVIKANNLKVTPEEALKAIELVNRIGARRGWNGLPHLLPGINLLYGLPGETRRTYSINISYLKEILRRGLMVRRINVRKVAVLENTPLWLRKNIVLRNLKRHAKLYKSHRLRIMMEIDKPMLRRIAPPGTLLRYLFTEKHMGGFTVARMPGSYPVTVKLRGGLPLGKIIDVRVIGVASKSVTAEPS